MDEGLNTCNLVLKMKDNLCTCIDGKNKLKIILVKPTEVKKCNDMKYDFTNGIHFNLTILIFCFRLIVIRNQTRVYIVAFRNKFTVSIVLATCFNFQHNQKLSPRFYIIYISPIYIIFI